MTVKSGTTVRRALDRGLVSERRHTVARPLLNHAWLDEWREGVKYRLDSGAHFVEESQYSLAPELGSLRELYVERKVSLELYVPLDVTRAERRAGVLTLDLRWSIRRADDRCSTSESLLMERHVGRVKRDSDGVEYPMLVDVREPTEKREWMRLRGLLSLVRLELADSPCVYRKESIPTPGPDSVPVLIPLEPILVPVRVDRPRDICDRPVRVCTAGAAAADDRELPGEVVEGGPEVVGDIADERTPLGRSFDDDELVRVASSLRLVLLDDAVRIRFQEIPDLVVQAPQVYVRPREFEPGAI
jgi:hypothetical protein